MAQEIPVFGLNWAFFLDVDGTLFDIVQHPEDVCCPSGLIDTLTSGCACTSARLSIRFELEQLARQRTGVLLEDKGRAIAAFMQTPAFSGHMPVFVGDDVIDEDGFAVANWRDGYSVKVGEGVTVAQGRLTDAGAALDWLRRYVQWHALQPTGQQVDNTRVSHAPE